MESLKFPASLSKQPSAMGGPKKAPKDAKDRPGKKAAQAGSTESKKNSASSTQLKDSEIDYFQNLRKND